MKTVIKIIIINFIFSFLYTYNYAENINLRGKTPPSIKKLKKKSAKIENYLKKKSSNYIKQKASIEDELISLRGGEAKSIKNKKTLYEEHDHDNNGIIDTWYGDENGNGKIDVAYIDDD